MSLSDVLMHLSNNLILESQQIRFLNYTENQINTVGIYNKY